MFRNVFKVHKLLRFYAATKQVYVLPKYNPNFNSIKPTTVLCSALVSIPFIFNVNNFGNNFKGDKNQQLLNAAKTGNAHLIQKILIENQNVDVNVRHSFGWTPLLVAVVNGHVNTCRELLKAGANPNLADEFSNKNQIANKLKINPAYVTKIREMEFCDKITTDVNYLGFTPLHYAVINEDFDIIKLLIEYGANPNLINSMNHSPIDYANDDALSNFMLECVEKYKIFQKKLQLEERRKFPLEQRLKQYIVGQEGAISIVSSTIRRKENGWTDDKHPLVFLFLGSSGIGKTELAKQVANYIHKNDRNGFIRLDMSEYQEKHEVAKLIGAPPGYVGHEDGGQLTKSLKNCENAVVLFDEVDKAHPDVLTVLLQLFDEGRLTDGKGKTIECTNAIFIMTSNLASDEIAQHGLELRDEASNLLNLQKLNQDRDVPIEVSRNFKDSVIKPILKRHFKRDEFLGRINEIVYFLPFSKNELLELVHKELEIWEKRALEKHNITLKWDQKVEAFLTNGYDVNYGARSIKYEVDRRVVNLLAEKYEMGDIQDKSIVEISLNPNQTSIVLKIVNNNDSYSQNSLLKNIGELFVSKA